MDLRSLKHRLGKLGPRPGPGRKATTAETRQELDHFLAEIEARPAGAAPHPDKSGQVEVLAELDRVQTILDNLYNRAPI
jgi:hypothetical protein